MSKFTKNSLKVLLILAIAHALVLTLFASPQALSPLTQFIFDLFYFETEKNLPSLFSSLLLLYAGYILLKLSQDAKATEDPKSRHWAIMSYVFIFLACDEWFVIHESFDKIQIASPEVMQQYPTWILFYIIPLIALSGYYIPFFLKIPFKTLFKMSMAGGIFLLGAAGLEIINYGVKYPMMVILEDGFEILGVLIFIEALTEYTKSKYKKTIPIPQHYAKWVLILTGIELLITRLINL